MKCIVVDDEPLAREIVTTYIEKVPELQLVGSFSNAMDAMSFLRTELVDLLFLDIQMPELTGLQMLQSMDKKPAVIFTTAYPEFAIQGFEVNATDYLLKPFSFDRFLKAVNKAMDSPNSKQLTDQDYMFIKTDKKMVKINFADIFYIEGLKDYVLIYTQKERLIALMTMKYLEQNLPANQFLRIHKSYIIGLNHMKAVSGNSVEINEKTIPVGKVYKEGLMKLLEKHNF